MTDEPEVIIRDMLRTRLTDPNPSRVASTPYIVDDWPYQTDLVTNHFPRISVISQFENNKGFGIGSSTFWATYRLQIDVWCKGDQPLTISATSYEGVKQVVKISRDLEEAMKSYWISDLANTGKFLLLVSYNAYSPKYEYAYNLWRRTIDVTFSKVQT